MNRHVPFVDLNAQYQSIAPAVGDAIAGVLASSAFILGPAVGRFEQEFADYLGVKHAIGMSNGLDALRLALIALGIGPGDEVIVPANTYIATALAVSAVGARPVLVDCDPATYNIDVQQIEAALSDRTRALMPVHLTGLAADMDAIMALAERHALPVIEDAAQAHGSCYHGHRCGSIARLGCFSFYPGKNLGAYGDAGMVVTNDAALAGQIRILANYGQEKKYVHVVEGVSARLDTIQAAVLSVKLPHLDAWNAARRRHAAHYRRLLSGVGDLTFQSVADEASHVYHLFMVETDRRDGLQRHLAEAGIDTGIHYPIPIHLQGAYAASGYQRGAFPASERLAERILSLPMYAELTDDDIAYVATATRDFFGTT